MLISEYTSKNIKLRKITAKQATKKCNILRKIVATRLGKHAARFTIHVETCLATNQ